MVVTYWSWDSWKKLTNCVGAPPRQQAAWWILHEQGRPWHVKGPGARKKVRPLYTQIMEMKFFLNFSMEILTRFLGNQWIVTPSSINFVKTPASNLNGRALPCPLSAVTGEHERIMRRRYCDRRSPWDDRRVGNRDALELFSINDSCCLLHVYMQCLQRPQLIAWLG
jgi:hypothetical protein